MKERRVRFTATASLHVEQEREWWLANRNHPNLFAIEIQSAVRMLAVLPGAGTPYTHTVTANLRRVYLRKLACHLYYTFDDEEVIVKAVWGARRAHGPSIDR